MILAIRELAKMYEEEDQLSVFFGTLERFNGEVKIHHDIVNKIEDYFQYRWSKNKNHAVSTEEDFNMLVQLPELVQAYIYSEFLFKDVMEHYGRYFSSLKLKSTWNRQESQTSIVQKAFVSHSLFHNDIIEDDYLKLF